ncbi:MAG: glycoside hydrolase family 5 protein [Butyrivibrio sp.]|nr:glycoside hydrolase family 5 protein [Butyrivibrio sp.]
MTENKKKIIVLVLTVLIAISLIFTGVNFGKYIRSRENVKTDKTTGDEKKTTPDFIAELNNGDEVTSEDEQVLPEDQPTQEKPAKEEPAKEEPDSGDHSKKVFDESDTNNDDWLHTDGSKIYDQSGKQVWLTGINWFGYNTGTNAFDGLWACDLNTSIEAIANHGFNLLRVPFSAELILEWEKGNYPNANFNQATNDYLVGKTSLEIWDYVVDLCRTNGIKIMVDIHSAKTDSMGHMTNMWYTDSVSTEQFQQALCWMAKRYKNNDTIIAFDLKNEPHGKPHEQDKAIWNDSKAKNNWKYVATETALKVLNINPNVLIMVEGIEIYPTDIKSNGNFSSTDEKDYYYNWWGGNLRGVADYPIDLGKYQDQLVYSPHDYGPTVFEQPWFKGDYTYESLKKDCWNDNWLFIKERNIAPLLIGEWGGFMKEPNLKWMTYMKQLIGDYHLNHTFWCFNANSGDTGGMVKDDFTTWDDEKYNFVKDVLWQENGKFVGLDHKIPLGKSGNGIALSKAKGL